MGTTNSTPKTTTTSSSSPDSFGPSAMMTPPQVTRGGRGLGRSGSSSAESKTSISSTESVTSNSNVSSTIVDPAVQKSLKRMYTSMKKSSTSSGVSRDTQNTGKSSIHDAFSPQVTNHECAVGQLRFRNGAVFQGVICQRGDDHLQNLDHIGDHDDRRRGLRSQTNVDMDGRETQVATFLTSQGECLHGIWEFQRLQYDLESSSPVALYEAELQILIKDGSMHAYRGPIHIMLKRGEILLPLARTLLEAPFSSKEKAKKAMQGKRLLQLSIHDSTGEEYSKVNVTEQFFTDNVQYERYPLISPHVQANSSRPEKGMKSFFSSSSLSSSIDDDEPAPENQGVSSESESITSTNTPEPSETVDDGVNGNGSSSNRDNSMPETKDKIKTKTKTKSKSKSKTRPPVLHSHSSEFEQRSNSSRISSGTISMSRYGHSTGDDAKITDNVKRKSRNNQNRIIRRDHRMLFWNLCGKEMAPSRWDDMISSDLKRTHFHRFLDRSPRTAQEQLHSILKYTAVAFPNIGYCQGMHCVAKFLLMFSEAPVVNTIQRTQTTNGHGLPPLHKKSSDPANETRARASSADKLTSKVVLETETAFVLFSQLLEDEKYRLQDLFHPSFEFFQTLLEDIDREIAHHEPVLFQHLQSCGLSAVVYAAKWMLTLFTFYVDQDFTSVCNVWLRFLSQGWDCIIDIATVCVCGVKEYLLNADSERCLLILSGTTEVTPHGILEPVFGTSRGQALLQSRRQRNQANSSSPPRPSMDKSESSRLPSPPPLQPDTDSRPASGSADGIPTSNDNHMLEKMEELQAHSIPVISRVVPSRRYTTEK